MNELFYKEGTEELLFNTALDAKTPARQTLYSQIQTIQRCARHNP